MDEIAIIVTKEELEKAVGPEYLTAIDSLVEQGILSSVKEVIEIRVSKDRALHIESILEFAKSSKLPSLPSNLNTRRGLE